MPRTPSNTVAFFSHDCDTQNRKTIFTLERKYGNDGYAFWFKLLEMLGKTEGHFLSLQEPDVKAFFVAKMGLEENICAEMLDLLVTLGAIDKELWMNFQVVWCQGFVDRLKPLYDKRHRELPLRPVFQHKKPTYAPVPDTKTGAKGNRNPQNKDNKESKTEINIDGKKPSINLEKILSMPEKERQELKSKPYACMVLYIQLHKKHRGEAPVFDQGAALRLFKVMLNAKWRVEDWLRKFFVSQDEFITVYRPEAFKKWVDRQLAKGDKR